MYIGLLKNHKETVFNHMGTSVTFPPSSVEDGKSTWRWNNAYDSAIDANTEFDCECFFGAVTASITEDSVIKAEVLVDGAVGGIYNAETGKCFGGTFTVPVGLKGKCVTLRLYTTLRDVTIFNIEYIGAHDDGKALVWPTPKSIEYLGDTVKIKDVVTLGEDEDALFAANFLKERLTEKLGAWKSEAGVSIVFVKDDTEDYDGERYTVRVKGDDIIVVTAKTRLTLLYGADTVLQVANNAGLRRFNCDDKPSKEFRGFHSGIPSLRNFEFMRRFFRYILLPLRYNMIIVEFAASMRYDSHPEIAEAWLKTRDGYEKGLLPAMPHFDMDAEGDVLEKEDVKKFIDYAKEIGFEVVPEVQSLGHVQYITMAHPELAEIEENEVVVDDTRTEDARPAAVYHHCYCPSLDASYRLIYDLIDEIVELVQPERYVHIGHDEVYQIGVCKRCRDKDPSDLFASDVNKIHDYIAEKYGLRIMIWSDMIQPPPVTVYKTYKAIDKLPKDVLMLDFIWYFNMGRDLEDNLLEAGYTVAVGNLYSSHYPRYSSRINKPGMIGGQISTWIGVSEEIFGNNGKFWDMIYLSEMLWNTENYEERNRKTYNHIISSYIQPAMRDDLRGKFLPCGYKTSEIKLPAPKDTLPRDLTDICPNAIIGRGKKIKIGGMYDRLVFEHATLYSAPRIVWIPFDKIGEYTVKYSDGSVVNVPVKYAENIMAYNTAYGMPMPQEFYRHNGYVGTWFSDPVYVGKNASGDDLTVSGFVWENPYPKKKIASVEYTPIENDYCELVLAGIKGLTRR